MYYGPHKLRSSTTVDTLKLLKQQKILKDYLDKNDIPSWFRGVSHYQIIAADALFYAIRDDAEQNTTHRTRESLKMMGLHPIISIKGTKLLMLLSQGNDLAFLWFLMDKFYKTSGPCYSLNEQIIMSLIAHLDMITTLRELNRILPPPQPARYPKRNTCHKIKPRQIFSYRPKRWALPRYKLPYFRIQPRPRMLESKVVMHEPLQRLSFHLYDDYKNPNHVVINETNRWYSTGNTDSIFKQHLPDHILTQNLDAMFTKSDSVLVEYNEVKCAKHRVVEELERSLEHKLKVIARQKCLEYFDVDKKRIEETHTRIRTQLENDVYMYMKRFKRLTERTRSVNSSSTLTVISKNDDFKHYKFGKHDKENQCPKVYNRTKGIFECNERKSGLKTPKESKVTVLRAECGPGDCSDLPFVLDDVNKHDAEQLKRKGKQKRSSLKPKTIRSYRDLCDCGQDYTKAYDFDNADKKSLSSSEMYFYAPKEHRPHRFDYDKIFHFKFEDPEELGVRRTFIRAIDSEVDMLTSKNPNHPPTLDEAIRNCAHKLWKEMVKMKQKKDEEFEKQRADSQDEGKLYYNQTSYDPNDKELMHRMLKDALTLMSANPKFVLASMPEAEKLSFLRLWMYRRYGKVYTRKELDAMSRESKRIFYAIDKLTLNVQQPSGRDIGPHLRVSYNCRDYIGSRVSRIRREYYSYLDEAIMEQSRDLWFAMCPYFCSKPPRNTYFAYMPSSLSDIHHFRIWRPSEFMDAKSAWMRRNILKKYYPKI